MKRSLILPAAAVVAGVGMVVAGVALWLGLAGALITAGTLLSAAGLLWERA